MGIFDLFKKNRREINRENQSQGKEGEEHIRRKYEFNGYKVKRTGRGHDFKAERKDWLTGKKETKVIEVKTTKNSPRLSELQKKKKRQYGRNYVVEELEPTPFGPISKDSILSNGRSSKKRRTERGTSRYDGLLGSDNSSGSRRKQSSGYDSMFGLGGNSGSRRKPSDGFDSMFGLGATSKSRRKKSDGLNDMFGF